MDQNTASDDVNTSAPAAATAGVVDNERDDTGNDISSDDDGVEVIGEDDDDEYDDDGQMTAAHDTTPGNGHTHSAMILHLVMVTHTARRTDTVLWPTCRLSWLPGNAVRKLAVE